MQNYVGVRQKVIIPLIWIQDNTFLRVQDQEVAFYQRLDNGTLEL